MARIELQALVQRFSQIRPETANLFSIFYTNFDNQSAANRRIVNVEPLYFKGAIAASEFLIYAATKLYLCLELIGNMADTDHVAACSYVQTYNEANAVSGQHGDNGYTHAPAGVDEYTPNDVIVHDLYFSRLVTQNYTYIQFNGFRITLI